MAAMFTSISLRQDKRQDARGGLTVTGLAPQKFETAVLPEMSRSFRGDQRMKLTAIKLWKYFWTLKGFDHIWHK